jgi:hypothetical protein
MSQLYLFLLYHSNLLIVWSFSINTNLFVLYKNTLRGNLGLVGKDSTQILQGSMWDLVDRWYISTFVSVVRVMRLFLTVMSARPSNSPKLFIIEKQTHLVGLANCWCDCLVCAEYLNRAIFKDYSCSTCKRHFPFNVDLA